MKQTGIGYWIAGAMLLTAPAAGWAHTGQSAGLVGGLIHPLTGWDHLLVMIAVGMLAVRAGGRALWLMPLLFMAALLSGGLMGLAGWTFGPVEGVIVASVIIMGAALILRTPAWPLIAGLTLFFGLFHGFAHGLEAGTAPGAFMAGMVMMSGLLHLAGGWFMARGLTRWGNGLSRVAGALMVAGGAAMAM